VGGEPAVFQNAFGAGILGLMMGGGEHFWLDGIPRSVAKKLAVM
jgi:hypothetical protein